MKLPAQEPSALHLGLLLISAAILNQPPGLAQRPSAAPTTKGTLSLDTPLTEARRHLHAGTKLTAEGKLPQAEEELLKALQAAEKSAQKGPNADLFQTLDALGKFYEFKKADYGRATQYYIRIQKLAEDTKAFDPSVVVPYYWSRMGAVHAKQQQYEPAIALLQKSLNALSNNEHANLPVLFMTREYLHDVYRAQGKRDKALSEAHQMAALAERIKDPNSKKHMLVKAVVNLADDYRVDNNLPQFEVQSRRAIGLMNTSLDLKDSDLMVAQLQNLGSHYFRQKKFALAEPLLSRAETIVRSRNPRDENLYAWIVGKLTLVQQARGNQLERHTKQTTPAIPSRQAIDAALSMPRNPSKPQDAKLVTKEQECRRQLAKALSSAPDPYRVEVALKIRDLADITYKEQQYEQSNALYQEALKILKSLFGPTDKEVAFTIERQAAALRSLGQTREAEALVLRANAIHTLVNKSEPRLPSQPSKHVKSPVSDRLRQAISKNTNPPPPVDPKLVKSAEACKADALSSLDKYGSPYHAQVVEPIGRLAVVWCRQRKYAEAEPLFQESIKICETLYGPNHQKVGELLMNYAQLLRKTGRESDAVRLEARAKTLNRKPATPTPANKR